MSEPASPGLGPEIGFGAKRVGVLFDRLRLHLETDRFLAERRRDAAWEVGCDYAVLALGRLASRLRPSVRESSLVREVAALRYGCAGISGAGDRALGSKNAALKGSATQTVHRSGTRVRMCRTIGAHKSKRTSRAASRSARR